MQNIETTIVELGGIFQQLAHMVKEQDEVVQRYVNCDPSHFFCLIYVVQYIIYCSIVSIVKNHLKTLCITLNNTNVSLPSGNLFSYQIFFHTSNIFSYYTSLNLFSNF